MSSAFDGRFRPGRVGNRLAQHGSDVGLEELQAVHEPRAGQAALVAPDGQHRLAQHVVVAVDLWASAAAIPS